MKTLLALFALFGCSRITEHDVYKAKLEVCEDLINLFIPPELKKDCSLDVKNNVIIIITNPATGKQHMYDSKTGNEIN